MQMVVLPPNLTPKKGDKWAFEAELSQRSYSWGSPHPIPESLPAILHTPYQRACLPFVSEPWSLGPGCTVGSRGALCGEQAVCTCDPLWQLRGAVLDYSCGPTWDIGGLVGPVGASL